MKFDYDPRLQLEECASIGESTLLMFELIRLIADVHKELHSDSDYLIWKHVQIAVSNALGDQNPDGSVIH